MKFGSIIKIKFSRFEYLLIGIIGFIIGGSISLYNYCHGWDDVFIDICQPFYMGIL